MSQSSMIINIFPKPDGTMKKLTDVTKLHGLGWEHEVELKDSIERMYNWYKEKAVVN